MSKSGKKQHADGLNPKQAAVLYFIVASLRDSGLAPSVQEISKECGISYSTVHNRKMELKRMGWIDWQPDKARTIQLLKPVPQKRVA
jgi:SOS-response transcriptional repressor LexA